MLIYYLKYLPGDFYANNASAGCASMIAYLLSMFLMKYVSIRASIITMYAVPLVCAVLLVFLENLGGLFIAAMVLGCKLNGGNFNNSYFANQEFYPAEFSASIFAITKFTASVFTIISPEVAEITPPVPIIIFIVFQIIGITVTIFLKKVEENEEVEPQSRYTLLGKEDSLVISKEEIK